MEFDILSNKVIGCALHVHKQLGPGLLESAYERCLARELEFSAIPFKLQVPMPIHYRGKDLDCGYRIDMLVEDTLLIELKSVQQLLSLYDAQVLTYMKLAKIKIGLLINFNVELLKDGIKRYVL